MKLLITGLLGILALLPKLAAQGLSSTTPTQVNYAASLGQPTIFLADRSTAVANGNKVWIGSFDAGFNIAANQNNPAALIAAWNNYGSTSINTMFGQPGHFSSSATSTDPAFNSQKIYLWIFSTDSATSPLPDFSNVNEYGLYSATTNTWIFPTLGATPPGNMTGINSTIVNQLYYGTLDANHLFLQNFNAVPEPSVVGLLGLAIPAAVLALRKRRSRP